MTDEQMKAFDDRMAERKKNQLAAEKLLEEQKVEKLRQDYLRRTGRTELKP